MENSTNDPTGGVIDRSDPPRGFLSTAWPLAALALLLLILLRACVPAAPVTVSPPPAIEPAAKTPQSGPADDAAGRTQASETPPTGR